MSDCRFGVSPVNYPDPDPDHRVCVRPAVLQIYTLCYMFVKHGLSGFFFFFFGFCFVLLLLLLLLFVLFVFLFFFFLFFFCVCVFGTVTRLTTFDVPTVFSRVYKI